MNVKEATHEYRLWQWMQVIAECHQSKKTVKNFCEQQGINVKSYYYWQRKIRKSASNGLLVCQQTDNNAIAVNEPVFAELNLSESRKNDKTAVTIRLSNAIVGIQSGADTAVIENALRALKNLC
jgi:hypothetical protein